MVYWTTCYVGCACWTLYRGVDETVSLCAHFFRCCVWLPSQCLEAKKIFSEPLNLALCVRAGNYYHNFFFIYYLCFQAGIWLGSLSLWYVEVLFFFIAHFIAHRLLCEILKKSAVLGMNSFHMCKYKACLGKFHSCTKSAVATAVCEVKWERPWARLSEWPSPLPLFPDQMQNAGCSVFSCMLVLYTMYISKNKCPVCK